MAGDTGTRAFPVSDSFTSDAFDVPSSLDFTHPSLCSFNADALCQPYQHLGQTKCESLFRERKSVASSRPAATGGVIDSEHDRSITEPDITGRIGPDEKRTHHHIMII
jgi:hypothetical protein